MPINTYRQEVFNVLLAQLLQERGVIAVPESVITSVLNGKKMPDLLVEFYGLQTAIEGEVGDQPDAEARALESARKRVELGIAHIGIAIVYPAYLRTSDFKLLKTELAQSQLRVAIVTEAEDTGFTDGNVDYLEAALRQAFDKLIREDVVAEAAAILDNAVEQFARAVSLSGADVSRLADILGIRDLSTAVTAEAEDSEEE
jgi:hypothetical protein